MKTWWTRRSIAPRPTARKSVYLHERRKQLGGYLPARVVTAPALDIPISPLALPN